LVDSKKTTEEIIKEAFLDIYKEKPLDKIKVSYFVDTCNISRSTFYFYFKDVYDLYSKCERDMILYLEEGLTDLCMSTIRANFKKHAKLYSNYLKKFIEKKDAIAMFIEGSEADSFHQALFDSVASWYSQVIKFSVDMDERKKEILVRFYSGGWVTMLEDWIKNGCDVPPSVIGDIIATLQYRGFFLQESP